MRKLQSTRNAHHRQKNGSKGANSEVPTERKRQPGHSCENNVRDKSSDETSEELKLIPTTSPCFSRMVTPRRLQHWQEVINAASDRVTSLHTRTALAALSMFMSRSEFLARASARAAGSALVVITWRSNCAHTLSECLIGISFR